VPRRRRAATLALLAVVAFAAGVVAATVLAGSPASAAPGVRTVALADVRVTQGQVAVFTFGIAGSAGRRVAVELFISRGGHEIVSVHLGRRRPGARRTQRLAIGLARGRYVWAVVPEDRSSASSTTVATLTVL
jgi:hypothetical protein